MGTPPASELSSNSSSRLQNDLQYYHYLNSRKPPSRCRTTLSNQMEWIFSFSRKIEELGYSPSEAVIIIANINDPFGAGIADELSPFSDWDFYRNLPNKAYARGLANRRFIQANLDTFAPDAGDMLVRIAGVAVVVVECGFVNVFSIDTLKPVAAGLTLRGFEPNIQWKRKKK